MYMYIYMYTYIANIYILLLIQGNVTFKHGLRELLRIRLTQYLYNGMYACKYIDKGLKLIKGVNI